MIQDVILPPAPLPHRALPKKGPAAGDIPLKRAWLTAVFGPLFRNSSYKIGSVATNLDEIHPPRLTRGFRKNGMTGARQLPAFSFRVSKISRRLFPNEKNHDMQVVFAWPARGFS